MSDHWIIALICIIAALCTYGVIVILYDMNRFHVVTYEIRSEKITVPYRFAMLSDLHNKAYGKGNQKLIDAIRPMEVDSIICAGDLFTSRPPGDYTHALELIRGIARDHRVYVANGNHETKVRTLPKLFGDAYDRYMEQIQEAGAKVLVNSRIHLSKANMDLCGLEIDRAYFKHFRQLQMPEGYVEDLVGSADTKAFQVLIAHHPNYFQNYAKWGADLVLSGHIHGGIVRLPVLGGVISPTIELFPKYDGGLYSIGKSRMILGRGLGTHTIPVRFWNPGEIVVVKLLPKED